VDRLPSPVQPPLLARAPLELYVAIAGLALGGAERIVLDWARRIQPLWTPHLIVLRDHADEWPVSSSVKVTRLGGVDVMPRLARIGAAISRSAVPVCVCHLLLAAERHALGSSGAFVVPVIHNAASGWLEAADALDAADHVIAVSEAAAAEVRRDAAAHAVSVIRHIEKPRQFPEDARKRLREGWRIPADARVIGMIGAVKPQKDYPFAVRLLRTLLEHRDVYLVIVGGPMGRHGRNAWNATLVEIQQSDVRCRIAMPGFVRDATACLPAFDLLLNTSDYEGLSVATVDALVNGIPIVASRVGGQGELNGDGLTLVAKGAPHGEWVEAVLRSIGGRPSPPAWAGFPSHRLWTLANHARPFDPSDRVLLVTANLNAGGAQRSLVNLATTLRHRRPEIAVTGDSTAEYFFEQLEASGIGCVRTAQSRDPFDHAEALVHKVCSDRVGVLCFWNVDPKIKLLLAKFLAFTRVAIIDVSPGPASFRELSDAADFARLVAFTANQFYERLDRLVLKYHGSAPASCASKVVVIPNGVASPARAKAGYDVAAGGGRVVVNGRIAPTKFLLEIVEAMALVRKRLPATELHIFGAAEPRHQTYADTLRIAIGDALGHSVFLHGAGARTIDALPDFDTFVVIGQDQGCPNALLEAMAAGLPCIANDDGGTAELIEDERTGLLVADRSAATIAAAITRLLIDRDLAARVGAAGRRHVLASCGLERMASLYERLFTAVASRATREKRA
jgi:glycosyltransferase involved in cell wall biosynthesis